MTSVWIFKRCQSRWPGESRDQCEGEFGHEGWHGAIFMRRGTVSWWLFNWPMKRCS